MEDNDFENEEIELEEQPSPRSFMPVYIKKKKPDMSLSGDYIGKPGTLDIDGSYIPKLRLPKVREVLPKKGHLHIPMRRSLFSGKKYATRHYKNNADSMYKSMCRDPNYGRKLIPSQGERLGEIKTPPRISRELKKHQQFMKDIGRGPKIGYLHPRHLGIEQSFLSVDGVVKVRIVRKDREDFFEKGGRKLTPTDIITGVVRDEEDY